MFAPETIIAKWSCNPLKRNKQHRKNSDPEMQYK